MSTPAPSPQGRPPEAWSSLVKLARITRQPFLRFLQLEAASGIVLLSAAALALAWANSPWSASYLALWHTQLGVTLGTFSFMRSLEWWVNDVLMVVFFFVVGMEIRREIAYGELAEWRRALLPVAAALGGMVAPALLYLALAASPPEAHAGWGVPMATDIAFAVGVMTLLGKRVPGSLRVLLLALAVIDDLGAILVIALFYSSGVAWSGVGVAALGVSAIVGMRGFGVRRKLAYVAPAFVVWAGTYASGVHPTIAGVVVGMLTPVRAWFGPERFAQTLAEQLEQLRTAEEPLELHQTLQRVGVARREAISPAESLIETHHPWVAYLIMPVFALANAGVVLDGVAWSGASLRVASGIVVGLVLGKPIGVLAACAVCLRTGAASLPAGLGLRHVIVLGLCAGIGFTMALFVAQLAFSSDPALLAAAKLGVLAASLLAALLALAAGQVLLKQRSLSPP